MHCTMCLSLRNCKALSLSYNVYKDSNRKQKKMLKHSNKRKIYFPCHKSTNKFVSMPTIRIS